MTDTQGPSGSVRTVHVGIFFEEDSINELFCELLRARGVHATILSGIPEESQETRIITEPQFFTRLGPLQRSRCLVVGNKTSLEKIQALSLSRPLTEEKVEQALAAFLVP